MDRKYNLKLDLQFRCNNSTMKFNQFDNNTSDFFMRITNGGNLVDIEKAIVVLATIKPSGKVSSQFVEVENGLVYADLKPNMKDEIGTYTAQAMLILEDERVVTDTINYEVNESKILSAFIEDAGNQEDYNLLTNMLSRLSTIEILEEQRQINEAERILAEENRKIEEAKRVEAELIRQHEEADRAKYDAIRESNENIRKINEETRISSENVRLENEANRIEQEANRVKAEQLRKDNYNFMTEDEERRRSEANAHKEAEVLRVQAETNRVNEEAKRRTTEQARVSAENTRVNNENVRKANETTRKNNETHRVEAETQRQNRYNSFISDAEANANEFENYTNTAKANEEERKSNELDRKSQEAKRVSNENTRISNENTRKANENTRKANEIAREKNETSRQNIFENKVDEVDEKIVEIDNTKDNFISSINTKVDTKISELDNAKSDMTTTVSNKVNEVETRFNALTSSQQQDAEVIDARDGETSLKARLDRDIEKAKEIYVPVEGKHISTDSSVGYAKDVEILGNTIQNASNLADIRSVGDKVEGQELYEIPILSVGKNLFDGNKFAPREAINQYSYIDGILTMRCDGQAYRRVDYILPNTLVHGKRYILTANVKALEYSSGYTPGQNFGYGYYNGGSADYYGSFDASSNTTKLEFVYNEQGENVIGFHNEVKEGLTKLQWSNIQIEEGTVATQYEPYQEDKLTILSPVQIEKVGDVADRIVEKNGVWGVEKNIGNITLDITKDWRFLSSNNTIWYPAKHDAKIWSQSIKSVACQIDFDSANNIVVVKDGLSSLEEYKNIMPIYVKYQLATPQFIPLPHDQQIKLRTFANKTNISFLTETEGTIKAQVPKSLGATVNTHTEQINNLNKELDRVKKLEESTVSTVTTESDFTTVEATSNGYFEDVKLEGKTLVNTVTTYDVSRFSLRNATKQDDGYFKLQYGTTVNDTNVIPRYGVHLYKPNTTYTIVVDIKENTTGTFLGISAINSCIDSTTISKRDFDNLTGISTITFKTRDDITISDKGVIPTYDLYFGIWKDGGDLSNHITFRYWVLEGDHTQNPPSFFEGLKSVGQSNTTSEDGADEVKVTTKNKNLICLDDLVITASVIGEYNVDKTTNSLTFKKLASAGSNNGFVGTWVDVSPNTNYTLTYDKVTGGNVWIYTDDFFGNAIVNAGTKPKFNSGNNTRLLIGFYTSGSVEVNEFRNIMLRNTNANSDFILPVSDKKQLLYYNNETQTWEKPILRQWDSIEKHADGKYYYHQRSAEIVLNGSEDWKLYSDPNSIECIPFEYVVNDKYNNPNTKALNLVNDKFSVKDADTVYAQDVEGIVDRLNLIRIKIQRSKLSTQDVAGFKQWLQANNVTVVYQLAEEKVYECTNIDLITYANETNYLVESGVLSPKTTLKVHSNISNVVSLLQKKVSLLESNITSYMITQNRLMLASRYNADTVSFKVDVATLRNSFEYDNDLYELILNNILVGKDNYNREYIENLIIFYWMDFIISDEMYSTLFEIIEEQHNPKIEEETPLI